MGMVWGACKRLRDLAEFLRKRHAGRVIGRASLYRSIRLRPSAENRCASRARDRPDFAANGSRDGAGIRTMTSPGGQFPDWRNALHLKFLVP